jgi:hypothetical protein
VRSVPNRGFAFCAAPEPGEKSIDDAEGDDKEQSPGKDYRLHKNPQQNAPRNIVHQNTAGRQLPPHNYSSPIISASRREYLYSEIYHRIAAACSCAKKKKGAAYGRAPFQTSSDLCPSPPLRACRLRTLS